MDNLLITDFTPLHLAEAGKIALHFWGGEVPDIPLALRPAIYQYLVHYYYMPQSELSVAALDDDGQLKGFILAATPEHTNSETAQNWRLIHPLTADEQRFFDLYQAYLDGNRKQEQCHVQKNEAFLLLFCSIQPGVGKVLLSEFKRRCRQQKLQSYLLWTDTTCNFDYYNRHGFCQAGRYLADPPLFGNAVETFLFRGSLAQE